MRRLGRLPDRGEIARADGRRSEDDRPGRSAEAVALGGRGVDRGVLADVERERGLGRERLVARGLVVGADVADLVEADLGRVVVLARGRVARADAGVQVAQHVVVGLAEQRVLLLAVGAIVGFVDAVGEHLGDAGYRERLVDERLRGRVDRIAVDVLERLVDARDLLEVGVVDPLVGVVDAGHPLQVRARPILGQRGQAQFLRESAGSAC